MFNKIFSGVSGYGLLPLRIAVGIIFIAHGAQKLFPVLGGGGLAMTIQNFQQYLGIPAFLTVVVALTEFLGGIALIAGALTRLASLGLFLNMVVATYLVHWNNGLFLNWYCNPPTQGHGIEYNLVLIGATLALFISGAGKCAVDNIFFKETPDAASEKVSPKG
ncbi:MAG TPA: DoxX family protein [bacterium]